MIISYLIAVLKVELLSDGEYHEDVRVAVSRRAPSGLRQRRRGQQETVHTDRLHTGYHRHRTSRENISRAATHRGGHRRVRLRAAQRARRGQRGGRARRHT